MAKTSQPIPIFAWDYSGSTSHNAYYHTHGANYLQQFIKSYSTSAIPPIYLIWSNNCNPTSLKGLTNIIKMKDGKGGTTPSSIIHWIKKSIPQGTPISLWLVTDGEIGSYDLNVCSKLNLELNYASINFIILSQHSKINMSVGAAFFGGSSIKIFMNEGLVKEIDTSKPFDYDKISVNNFEACLPELSDFIQAKFMGTEVQGLEEVEKLKKLRNRLFLERDKQEMLNNREDLNCEDKWNFNDKHALLRWLKGTKFYKTLNNSSEMGNRITIETSVSTLINYIHNKNKDCRFFDILKFDLKQQNMRPVPEMEPDLEVSSLQDAEKCSFFDAVSLEVEESTPVLFLNYCDLIDKYWENGNYKKFKRVSDCPLFGEFPDCVGHVFGLTTVKQLYDNSDPDYDSDYEDGVPLRNPMTNQRTPGGLILSSNCDAWNDNLLLKTFFRSKKIRTCPSLFYYRIYKYAQTCDWIDSEVTTLLKKYACRRLFTDKTLMGFSSLPLFDPKEIVPVPLALLFCSELSSRLFAQDAHNFMQERLRLFYSKAKDIIKIMGDLKINSFDDDFVRKRSQIFKLLAKLKTLGNISEQRYWFLSQCFENQGPFLTWNVKDQQLFELLPLLSYGHKQLIPLENLIGPTLNEIVLISYDYHSEEFAPILPQTLRPQFLFREGNEIVPNYKKILKCVTQISLANNTGNIYQVTKPLMLDQTKLLSLHKMYIQVTTELGHYPENLAEFENFVWKSKRFSRNKIRLFPPQVRDWVTETFVHYDEAFRWKLNVEEFISRGKQTVNVLERLKIEKVNEIKNEVLDQKFVNMVMNKWLVK